MKRVFNIVLILTLISGASVAGYQYLSPPAQKTHNLAEDPTIEIVEVERETLLDTVDATGRIEPKAEVEMKFEIGGVVKEVLVERGQAVTAGAVLARLDPEDLELAVQRAQIDLAQQEAGLEKLYERPLSEEIAAAEASLASAEAKLAEELKGPDQNDITIAAAELRRTEIALKQAQWDYDQVAYRGDVGASAQADALQEATLDYEAALAEYNQNNVAGPTDAEIAEARSAVAQARSSLAELRRAPSPADIASQQAAVDRAKLDLVEQRSSLEKAELVAPIDGVIVEIGVEPGERTFDEAQDAVLILADTSAYLLKVEVDEIDIGRIKPGQTAAIALDAFAEAELKGRVVDVSPRPTQTESDTNSIVTYEVTIAVQAAQEIATLLPGMTATAAIETERLEEALVVPNQAVQIERRPDGVTIYVEKLDEQDNLMRVEVELGLRNGSVTEITAGLEAGDRVIIRSQPGVGPQPDI